MTWLRMKVSSTQQEANCRGKEFPLTEHIQGMSADDRKLTAARDEEISFAKQGRKDAYLGH